MVMTKCNECKAAVSDKAKACPACGAYIKKKHSWVQWSIIGLATIGIVSCIATQQSADEKKAAQVASVEAQKSPEQRAAEAAQKAEKEIQFQRIANGAKTLKQMSKNPDSFKLDTAILMPSGVACYSYRATNSFNAVVPGYAALVKDKLLLSNADWQKHCNGKTGADFSYVR